MSTDESESEMSAAVAEAPEQTESSESEPKRKLELDVAITDSGPCKKHLKITIPRSEIDLQYEESLESLRKEAVVPGFRPGRAPRQLVVKRFRKQVSQQVKANLLKRLSIRSTRNTSSSPSYSLSSTSTRSRSRKTGT